MARSRRRKYPPHPPFGHLLPGGEKGTVPAPAERVDCRGESERTPSPHRGEGRGEGVRAVASSEESQLNSHDCNPRVTTSRNSRARRAIAFNAFGLRRTRDQGAKMFSQQSGISRPVEATGWSSL